MSDAPEIHEIKIVKYARNAFAERDDPVIKERRLDIFIDGEKYISLMCLPRHLEELTLGFLYSEGLINCDSDVKSMTIKAATDALAAIESPAEVPTAIIPIANGPATDMPAAIESADDAFVVFVTLGDTSLREAKPGNRVIVSGFAKGSVNQPFMDWPRAPELKSDPERDIKISPDEITRMAASFDARSDLFARTGAVHSCLLTLPTGQSLYYEDIGRHNAVDKIIGKAIKDDLDLKGSLLFTSGRISSEMIIKVARRGIPILISTSAPTDMAVKIACELNMTLIGFARGDRFNIYSGDSRVKS